jgi:hypothetical protein
MWREEQKMPSKSQIALALHHQKPPLRQPALNFKNGREEDHQRQSSQEGRKKKERYSRLRIQLIQKPASIILMKHPRETPRLMLKGLHILNLNEQDIAWLRGLDFKGSREVVDLSQIDILDVVGRVVVADLAAGPVQTLDFDDFAVFDGSAEGDCSFIR